MKPFSLVLSLAVVGAVTAGGWIWVNSAAAQRESDLVKTAAVTVPRALTVRMETVADSHGMSARRFIGRLDPASTVDIAFQVSGQILEILPEEGSRVAQGDMIARLDPADYRLALSRVEAVLRLARSDEARAAQLVNRAVAPEAQLDRARAELTQAEVALDQARRALDQTVIEAPFDSLVARRLAEPFSNASLATPVVRLQDVSQLYVTISLPEDLAQLARAMPDAFEATARFPALPELAVPVTIDRFVTEADPVAQTYTVKLMLSTPDPRLLPGMTSTVEIRLRDAGPAVSVPFSSVDVTSGPTPRIWVVTEGDIAVPRDVRLGLPQGDRVVVTDGVRAGERIVTAGWWQLTEGALVRPALF